MKRPSFLLLLALAGAAMVTPLHAATVTPDQALARALAASPRKAPGAVSPDYRLTFSQGNDIYVFTDASTGGFLAVPGDDIAPAILGYADSGIFSADSIPPAMQWWLSEYSRQIEAAEAAGLTPARITRPERKPIAPLLSSLWDQNSPYNDLCPVISGSRSVTGCAATAMAQVMRWHQWPEKGQGSYSYYSNGTLLTLDFSKITFDWASMQDYYTASSSSASRTAVAELMYACGVSINMQYSPNASWASDFDVPQALTSYFGYDAGAHYVMRDFFGLIEWEDYIYNQLTEYGPVQYSGQGSDGGHSFVCDGYSSDGFFHINWGWGGMSDGYFLLTALDPAQQGIGGSTSGYNYAQSVVADVCKPQEGSIMYPNMLMYSSIGVSESSASADNQITVTGSTYNFSTGNLSGKMGVKFTAADGSVTYANGSEIDTLEPLAGIGGYYAIMPSLSAGNYTLTPVFMPSYSEEWFDVPVRLSEVRQIEVSVSADGKATFTSGPTASIKAENLSLGSDIYMGEQFLLSATLVNTSEEEFYGTVQPALFTDAVTIYALGDTYPADVLPGESQQIDYIGAFGQFFTSSPKEGTYRLALIDEELNVLSNMIEVYVHAAPSKISVSVSDFKVAGDSDNTDRGEITFEGTISCSQGYFGGQLPVWIFPYTSGQISGLAYVMSDPVFISAGQSAEFKATGTFSEGMPGANYFALVYYGEDVVSDYAFFTIKANTSDIAPETIGIPDIYPTLTSGPVSVSGEDVSLIRVFNTAGSEIISTDGSSSQINLAPYPSGVYIIEVTYGEDRQQKLTRRVIRR